MRLTFVGGADGRRRRSPSPAWPVLPGRRHRLRSVQRNLVDSISVVIPARDEVGRIGPLLDLIVGAPGVHEVIVVDDQSTDGTADIAARRGARVIGGAPLPHGWAGKAWAVQQGLLAASTEWVVTLDADTRPGPRSARVARGEGGDRSIRPR